MIYSYKKCIFSPCKKFSIGCDPFDSLNSWPFWPVFDSKLGLFFQIRSQFSRSCSKRAWLHRETMDFFFSKNHVIEEILKFFFCQYLLFWVILKTQQSDYHIFTFSKCKDDLTGLFTSQTIAVVALSTAPVCRLRAPSAGAPTVSPLAPHPAAPQQLSLACHCLDKCGLDPDVFREEPGESCKHEFFISCMIISINA